MDNKFLGNKNSPIQLDRNNMIRQLNAQISGEHDVIANCYHLYTRHTSSCMCISCSQQPELLTRR